MHFYTALDWTCQDWTRADLPFSHSALGRKMGSPALEFLLFQLRCWKPFAFCTGTKPRPFETLHGSQWEGHPQSPRERREQGSYQHSPERVSFGARECPESNTGDSRTAVGTGHRVSDTSDCLLLSVLTWSLEMWQLSVRSHVTLNSGVTVWAPANPQHPGAHCTWKRPYWSPRNDHADLKNVAEWPCYLENCFHRVNLHVLHYRGVEIQTQDPKSEIPNYHFNCCCSLGLDLTLSSSPFQPIQLYDFLHQKTEGWPWYQ